MVSMRSVMARTKARRSVIIVALPRDVVVDIVGLVVTSSPLQPTSHAMYKPSKEHAVRRHVALEHKKPMKWLDNEHYLPVVKHLTGASNPKAYFIISLTLVFAHQDIQRSLMCLDRAAVAGHKAAAYVLGLLLYTASKAHDIGKHYNSQVKGELADGGCEMAKRTNRECRPCRKLAEDAVQDAMWKKMSGPQGQVLALPEDGHRCTSTGYDVTEGWGDYVIFCSDDYRIRHEYAKFFAQVLNYLS